MSKKIKGLTHSTDLPPANIEFKRVIFNEDFNEEDVIKYIESGYSVHIRSSRKIKKKDRKVWNKLRAVGLNEDHMVFGEVRDLDKRFNYDLLMTGNDPLLERLILSGQPISNYSIIKSKPVENNLELLEAQKMVEDIDLKFVTVKVVYTYELRDELKGDKKIIPGSRDFCRKMVDSNKSWTLEELQSVSTKHLSDMGLPTDILYYRGGFWNRGGGNISPSCRHIFKANVVIEK